MGIDACLRWARECLYWLSMSNEIKDAIAICQICDKYNISQSKETLMSHIVPDRTWVKVSTNLFVFDGNDYLITVDYHSNFWEINKIEATLATTVIKKLKTHFEDMVAQNR